MRKTLLPFLFLLPLYANAQFNIGYDKYNRYRKISSIEDEQLELLKKTTTVFVLPDKDSQNVASFEQAIKSVWSITPFLIAKASEIPVYSNKKQYSIFKFRHWKQSVRVSNGPKSTGASVTSVYLAYELWITDGTGDTRSHVIAGVELYPESELFGKIYTGSTTDELSARPERTTTKMLKDYTIYNWGPGFLKGYLKSLQDAIVNQKRRDPMYGVSENDRLISLKTDTLYVPDYVSIKYNPFTIEENETDMEDESLSQAYPYPVKLVSAEELNKLILTQPIKYLVFTKSSSAKIINVYDSKDGALLYATTNRSYKFKYKDLRKLAREID